MANNAYFVVTTRKFSNEMKFLVEPLYWNQYILSWPSSLVYCVQCTLYMLSNVCSRSKRWDYIIKHTAKHIRYYQLSVETPWQLYIKLAVWVATAELQSATTA